MPKYVEIKDKEGKPAGYVMDHEDGYQVVHDKNGQPSAYVYDHEQIAHDVVSNYKYAPKSNSSGSSRSITIEDDGLFYCVLYYGICNLTWIIPLILLLFGKFLAALIDLPLLFGLFFLNLFLLPEKFSKYHQSDGKPTFKDWCKMLIIIQSYFAVLAPSFSW